jgi:diguanylate cyclase (GGDEF)-like protein/PAS domain S-box-containing protein
VVYLNSSSFNELFFTLQEFIPYLLISLIIAFYTYDNRKSNFLEQIKKSNIPPPIGKGSKETLEVLYKISNAVHTTDNLEDLLCDVHKILSTNMDVKNIFVVITDGKNIECPFFVDQYDDYKEVFKNLNKLKKFSIAGHIIQNRKAMVLKKEDMLQLAMDHGAQITGKLSEIYIGIPLKILNEVIGVIAIQDYENPNAYSKNDIKLLNLVSKQIALTIERKRNDIKLRDGEKNFRMITENATDIILKTDDKLNFTYISPSAEAFTGYSISELSKKKLTDWLVEKERDRVKKLILGEIAALPKNGDSSVMHRTLDQLLDMKGGATKWIDLRYKIMSDEINGVQVLAILRDISPRKEFEMNLLYQVNHDNLTCLHNRKAFIEELQKTIEYASRYDEKRVILFIDIDNFKMVNDTFGHGKGDLILQEISKRLKSVLRKTDFLARLGGDEFTVILNNPCKQNQQTVIDKIQQSISAPYIMDEISIDYISASIGISVYPDDGTDHETLISFADSEMYRVKDEKSRSTREKEDN